MRSGMPAQFQLREAVGLAGAVLDAVPDPLFIKDAASVYLWANRAWGELMGQDPDRILGKTDGALFPPDVAVAHTELDCVALATTQAAKDTVLIETPGRPNRYVRITVRAIVSPEGAISGLLGSARQVSEKRPGTKPLHTGANYRDAMSLCTRSLLMSRSSDGAISGFLQHLGEINRVESVTVFENFTTPEGDLWFRERYRWRHADCSCGAGRSAGMPYGPWLVRWHDMLSMGLPVQGTRETLPPEESRALAEQQLAAILLLPLEENRQFWGFIRLAHCTIERQWEDDEVQMLSVAAESLSAFLTRVQYETALHRKVREQEALWTGTPDFLYITDKNSVYLMANPAYAEFLGVSADDIPGKTDLDFFPREKAERYQREDRTIVETGATLTNIEDTTPGANGRSIQTITTKAPLRDAAGAVVGIIGITRDVTERVELERQVRQAQKMESIGTLAAGIAHDFNNLLTAILGFAHLSLPKLDEGEPLYRYMERIIAAGARAQDLIRQLLTFSRQVEAEKRPMLLGPVVKETLKFLRSTLPAHVEIISSVPDGLPHVEADPTQMHQVIMNLCVNAAHAMPDGGTLSVRLDHLVPDRAIQFTIEDTGCGMDDETKARIFEPFFTTKEPGEGTGLGLSTVYGIVKDSGGTIDVESAPGEGTTFRVRFPVTTAPARREQAADAQTSGGGSETILFADNEPSVLELARATLDEAGYTVLTASDGAHALSIYEQHEGRVHLLIIDAAMPRMTGTKLVHQLLLDPRRRAKIILCSGQAMRDDDRRTVEEAGGALLHKPFIPSELLALVRRVLDQR